MKRRKLTDPERWLCKLLFGNSLPSDRIEVVRHRLFDFGGITPRFRIHADMDQFRETYMAPDPRDNPPDVDKGHWFVHELVHCWQYYQGVYTLAAKGRARREAREHRESHAETRDKAISDNLVHGRSYARRAWRGVKSHSEYEYDGASGADLADFNMEMQADIIADWFALVHWTDGKGQPYRHGQPRHASPAGTTPNYNAYGHAWSRAQLEKILGAFLADPTYIRAASPARARRAERRQLDAS